MIISSTGAITGSLSPLGGSYAGAKRMQWFLAHYFQQGAHRLHLGHMAVSASAAWQGISEQALLERYGETLTPQGVGRGVVSLVTDDTYKDGIAYRLSGQGLELLD